MTLPRRQFLCLAAGAAALATVSQITGAQSYPTRPITLIVPFPAGAATDAIGRILGDSMRASLGQPIVIENVTGANGSIGVGRGARAANDGYTITIGAWSTFVANGVAYTLPYNLLTDFEPIALLTTHPHVNVAKKIMPADDLKGLIAWLKAYPDKATAGTNGVGSPQHVAAIFFQNETGTRFGFVPYRGGAPAFQDLLAGQIDLIFAPTGEAAALIRGGSIKVYAVIAQNRIAAAPDLPTVDEGGMPGLYMSNWFGLWAPARTAKDVISKLNTAAIKALADPTVRTRLADLGQEIFPSY